MIYKELLDVIFKDRPDICVTADIYLKTSEKGEFMHHHNEPIARWNCKSDYEKFKVVSLKMVDNDYFSVCLEEDNDA